MSLQSMGGQVSPISMLESSSVESLVALSLTDLRVTRLQVGAGFDRISHAHFARYRARSSSSESWSRCESMPPFRDALDLDEDADAAADVV